MFSNEKSLRFMFDEITGSNFECSLSLSLSLEEKCELYSTGKVFIMEFCSLISTHLHKVRLTGDF